MSRLAEARRSSVVSSLLVSARDAIYYLTSEQTSNSARAGVSFVPRSNILLYCCLFGCWFSALFATIKLRCKLMQPLPERNSRQRLGGLFCQARAQCVKAPPQPRLNRAHIFHELSHHSLVFLSGIPNFCDFRQCEFPQFFLRERQGSGQISSRR